MHGLAKRRNFKKSKVGRENYGLLRFFVVMSFQSLQVRTRSAGFSQHEGRRADGDSDHDGDDDGDHDGDDDGDDDDDDDDDGGGDDGDDDDDDDDADAGGGGGDDGDDDEIISRINRSVQINRSLRSGEVPWPLREASQVATSWVWRSQPHVLVWSGLCYAQRQPLDALSSHGETWIS